MPIEFRCLQCNKLLRVGDDAAGKQAKCPGCGMVQVIPTPAVPVEPAARPRAPDPAFGGGPLGFDLNQLTGYADNPYAAPVSAAMPLGEVRRQTGPRTGPSWERDGASLASFFASARDFFLSPVQFYSQMRRTGGTWSPSGFAAAGSLVGCGLWMTYWLAYTLLLQNGPLQEMPPADPERVGYILGMLGAYCCCSGVMGPMALLAFAFCAAGLVHLCLQVLGAATYSYETTFRVVAYALGSTLLISIVPLCGFYLAFPVQLVYIAIGVKYAQETSTGAAVAGVMLPTMICGGGFTLLFVAAVMAA